MECHLSYSYCNWYGQLSSSTEKSDHDVRDNTHMTSMKIIQFSRHPPAPLSIYLQNYITPLSLDVHVRTKPPPPPSSNDNQSVKRKHNPRTTFICHQVLLSGRLSFFSLCSLILHGFPLTSFHLLEASLSAFSWSYALVCAVVQKYHKLSFIYNCSHFSTHFAINLFHLKNLKM